MSCSICGVKEAVYKCRVCGRTVCRDDYVLEKGICRVCEETMCQICGNNLSIGYCRVCGRLGCEDCLVQVSPVSYICRECLSKEREKM